MSGKKMRQFLAKEYDNEPKSTPAFLDRQGYIHPAHKKQMTDEEKLVDSVVNTILKVIFVLYIVAWLSGVGLMMAGVFGPVGYFVYILVVSLVVLLVVAPLCKLSRHLEGKHSMGRDW